MELRLSVLVTRIDHDKASLRRDSECGNESVKSWTCAMHAVIEDRDIAICRCNLIL